MSGGQHQGQQAAVAVPGDDASSSTDHVDQSRQVSHGPFGRKDFGVLVTVAEPGPVVGHRPGPSCQGSEYRAPAQRRVIPASDQDHARRAGPGLDPAQHAAPEVEPAAGHGHDLAQRLEHQVGHDSARCILITVSKSGSGVRPSRAARPAWIRAGQVANMAATAGSGTQSIRALTCGPATLVRAAAMSATVTVRAGMVSAVRPPQAWSEDVAAHSSAPTALAGEARATRVPGSTGQTARWPASGSRTMPDRKPEAAAFGRPGRTLTVIRRTARPFRKPLRV